MLCLTDVSRFADEADERRAREAAERVLARHDAEAACLAYAAAVEAGRDPRDYSPAAAIWDAAQSAANIALTEGWRDNTTDEGCGIDWR